MRVLSWNRTSKDLFILEEMREYVQSKNGCYCMFPTVLIKVNNTRPTKIYVDIEATTKFKENLAYYALCNIAQGYGAYAS